jgi:DNA-binding CsgD family transcriptional regulator
VPAASAPDVPGPANTPGTSKREKEILDLLAKGYTTPQIAEALSLSPETVKWYRKKLLVKFDAANTAELVLAARKAGEI